MTTKDYIFITTGGDETAYPLEVTFDVITCLSSGVSGEVDRFGVSKMPKLIIVRKAGAPSPVKKNQFHV